MRNAVRTRKVTGCRNPTILGFALLALWLGGHASAEAAQTPTSEAVSGAPEDGLHQVPIEGAGAFWIRPGIDLGAYDRVLLKPASVEYKRPTRHYRIDPVRRGVLLTKRDREKLQQSFYDAFKTGLASGEGFGPASKSDPGLLLITTSFVDVVVRNHRQPIGNELHMVDDYGEMTLRIEFSDSQTGETMARFEERRKIGPAEEFVGSVFRKDGYSYWRAVRANLSRWSELVRRRMHDQRAAAVRF